MKCPKCGQAQRVPGGETQDSNDDSQGPPAHTPGEALAPDDALAALAAGDVTMDEPASIGPDDVDHDEIDEAAVAAGELPYGASMALASLADSEDEATPSGVANRLDNLASGENDGATSSDEQRGDDQKSKKDRKRERREQRRQSQDTAKPHASGGSASSSQTAVKSPPRKEHEREATSQAARTKSPERPMAIPLNQATKSSIKPVQIRPKAKSGAEPDKSDRPSTPKTMADIPPAQRPLPTSARLRAEPSDWELQAKKPDANESGTVAEGSPLLREVAESVEPPRRKFSESANRSQRGPKKAPNYPSLLIMAWMLRACGIIGIGLIYKTGQAMMGDDLLTISSIFVMAVCAFVSITVFWAAGDALEALRDLTRNSFNRR